MPRLALVVMIVVASGNRARADEPDDPDEPTEPTDPEPGEPGTDEVQPPMTAGGLFTLATYPVNELQRPLTMTQKITQLRLSLGTDLGPHTAFESVGVSLDGRYGYTDNFMLLGGFQSDYNLAGYNVYAGFEGALVYDVVDLRVVGRLGRSAVVDATDMNGVPTGFKAGAGSQLSLDIGFPFRYVATPQIAIVALETLISFDFNAVTRDAGMNTSKSCFAAMADLKNCTENGVKPDLAPSLGIATNPIPELSVVLFAQLQVRDFDTTNQVAIPATARVQYSPNQRLDIGLEFKLLNLVPVDPDGDGPMLAPSPIDQRFLNLYMQARY